MGEWRTYVWFSPFGLKKYAAKLRAPMTTRPTRRDHLFKVQCQQSLLQSLPVAFL